MPWTKPDTADAAWAVRVRRLMSVMHRGRCSPDPERAHPHHRAVERGEQEAQVPGDEDHRARDHDDERLVSRVATWGTTSAASTPHAEYSATMEPPSAALPRRR